MPGFPQWRGGTGGDPPTTREIGLSPTPCPPHCFDPKMLIFSCSSWPFCPNCPLPPLLVDLNWETLYAVIKLHAISLTCYSSTYGLWSIDKMFFFAHLLELKQFVIPNRIRKNC